MSVSSRLGTLNASLLTLGLAAQFFLWSRLDGDVVRVALGLSIGTHLLLAWRLSQDASPQTTAQEGEPSTDLAVPPTGEQPIEPRVRPAISTARPPAPRQTRTLTDLTALSLLDTRAGLRQHDGDEATYLAEIGRFDMSWRQGVAHWAAWIDGGRWADLLQAARRLSAEAGRIGAGAVQTAALRLKMQFASEDSLGSHVCLPALQEELERLLAQLNNARQAPALASPAADSHAWLSPPHHVTQSSPPSAT